MRVLDVGCGAGMTAKLLRDRFPGIHVAGVEPDPELAVLARQLDVDVLAGAIDSGVIQEQLTADNCFDLIICADVLEHLEDPWDTLKKLAAFLTPGGRIITSIPNVRHASTFWSLGLMGRWPRRDRGIHDRTHLRFFARRDVLDLGRSAGLTLLRERRNVRLLEAAAWTQPVARVLDFWPFRPFVTFQYLHVWAHAMHGDH